MKSNPFYALSASAMLLGCWLLSEALHLQAGQLGGLLLLISVLQLYEVLLVGLGTLLVRTGRAPRDGVTVLVLETVFLMDAPLLAAECVTADARVGTVVAVLLSVLAVAKLGWVRHAAPALLSPRAARLLGVQAAFVLSLPVVAAHLAGARAFGPVPLYGLWWATLALPRAQRALHRETRAHPIWTWVPAALVLLHLWALGYIHAVAFQPAFLAPLLLGLAATAGREQLARKVALPGVAVLLSLGQRASLGFALPGMGGSLVSPVRLALFAVGITWAYLAWRDRERWLVVLAAGSGVAVLLGASVSRLSGLVGRLLRLVDSLLPRDAFGLGVLTVIAAFVLLAAGARRSLDAWPRRPPRGRRTPLAPSVPREPWREAAAVALALAVFALCAMGATFESLPLGYSKQHGAALLASLAGAAAFAVAARARDRAGREPHDPGGRQLAGLAMGAGALGLVVAMVPLVSRGPQPGRWESAVIGDIRTVISAQAAYQTANGGFFDSRLSCLEAPSGCIPAYPASGPRFLEGPQARLEARNGYDRSFVPGPPADGDPTSTSPSSTSSFAYLAVPTRPGERGVRGFCGDSSGDLCFTTDGRAPGVVAGRCDLATCEVLR